MGIFSGEFYSSDLQKTTSLRVIFPDSSNDVTPIVEGEPRVLYLLHGLSGNSAEWSRFSKIEYYAKKYNFIIIMPESDRSFYCDTVCGTRYFTYVADELPVLCSRWFNLTKDPSCTFIAGESMGGCGAVKIALRRPGQYEAVASLSGVLDYPAMVQRVLDGSWPDMQPKEFQAIHGGSGLPKPEDDPLFLVQKMAANPARPRLLQMCGTEDFLYEDNQRFRRAAEAAGYGHTYREEPGDHEWPYWDKAIQCAFQFFCGMDIDTSPLF